MDTPYAKKKLIWINIIFFTVNAILGLVCAPIYIYHNGISGFEIGLTLFYLITSGLGITVGYHRLFSHASYTAHPIVKAIMLFFGASAFEQTALDWSTQHRDHHRYVDTDKDPYSIKKGFWYAHIGWLVAYKHVMNYDNCKDLQQDKLLMNQHKYYGLWAVGSGIVVPLLIGAAAGYFWGALFLAVGFRITAVYHSTFFINSICHMFGKATYDEHATAKDNWLIAFLTYGEGYHNFHHRFPSDYRNAVLWYQWDPSKWTIALLEKIGLAKNLTRVSKFRIMEARIKSENRILNEDLKGSKESIKLADCVERVKASYQHVKSCLARWEEAFRDYQNLKKETSKIPHNVYQAASAKLKQSAEIFESAHKEWSSIIKLRPLELQNRLLSA